MSVEEKSSMDGRVQKLLRIALSFFFLLNIQACSVNILTEFADKTSDPALRVEAKKLINRGDYQGALDRISLMSTDYQARRDIVVLRASAYGGLCGLDFLNLILALGNLSGQSILEMLLSTYVAGTVDRVTACGNAENLIESISPDENLRTADENLLMFLLNLAKMGTVLAQSPADADDDGIVDGGFDQCSSIVEADVRDFGYSFLLALKAIGGQTVLDPSLVPTGICSLPPPFDTVCDRSSPADFTADEVRLFRGVIGDDTSGARIGLGTCGAGVDFATCAVLCP